MSSVRTVRWPLLGRAARDDDTDPARFVAWAYRILLRREPDPDGLASFGVALRSGSLSREELLDKIMASDEFSNVLELAHRDDTSSSDAIAALHASREQWVRSLPRARRILDLGGSGLDDPNGAFVALGYPYDFDQLVVVDLPLDARHDIYRRGEVPVHVDSPRGPIDYLYQSMADLDGFPDASFDMVFCGEAIEHIDEADGERLVNGAFRVLRPGGWFAFDTNNGPVCRVQSPVPMNPDHKIEYAPSQLSSLVRMAGFEIAELKGLGYVGRSLAQGFFSLDELGSNPGVFADYAACYLVAYLCRKPRR